MKKIFTIAVMVVAVSSFTLGQIKNANTGGPNNEKQAVMQLEREIANAYVQGDAKTLERIFADDLTNTTDNGFVLTKQNLLQNLKPMAGVTIDVSGLKPRVYDKAAVVTGILVFRFTDADREAADYLCVTDTFVKQQKGWRLIATQQRRIPMWMGHRVDESELKPAVAQDCSQESSLRSINSESPAFIRFTNKTSQSVVVYWLNYQGERDPSEDQVAFAHKRQDTANQALHG